MPTIETLQKIIAWAVGISQPNKDLEEFIERKKQELAELQKASIKKPISKELKK